jgi:hypothetical protein
MHSPYFNLLLLLPLLLQWYVQTDSDNTTHTHTSPYFNLLLLLLLQCCFHCCCSGTFKQTQTTHHTHTHTSPYFNLLQCCFHCCCSGTFKQTQTTPHTHIPLLQPAAAAAAAAVRSKHRKKVKTWLLPNWPFRLFCPHFKMLHVCYLHKRTIGVIICSGTFKQTHDNTTHTSLQ